MSGAEHSQRSPKAIIHKQILEVAEANPDASIETIAGQVSGAVPNLVERVLDTYGDPAGEQTQQSAQTNTTDHEMMSEDTKYDSPGLAREEDQTAQQALEHQAKGDDGDQAHDENEDQDTQSPEDEGVESSPMPIDDLSTDQKEVLRAIANHPEATQKELAEQFDVTSTTINRWVNSISGFEWQNRVEFVERYFDAENRISDGGVQTQADPEANLTDIEQRLAELETQLATITQHVDEIEQQLEASEETDVSPAMDTELFAKAVRACITDEQITEDEETKIITQLR